MLAKELEEERKKPSPKPLNDVRERLAQRAREVRQAEEEEEEEEEEMNPWDNNSTEESMEGSLGETNNPQGSIGMEEKMDLEEETDNKTTEESVTNSAISNPVVVPFLMAFSLAWVGFALGSLVSAGIVFLITFCNTYQTDFANSASQLLDKLLSSLFQILESAKNLFPQRAKKDD